MKVRKVIIFTGKRFEVPQGIQRIDHLATHGWQVRYGGTKLFSDHTPDGSGAAASLAKAVKELVARIAKLPTPTALQSTPNANKTSDLPVGIFGPIVRQRRGSKMREASLSVSLPRFGSRPRGRSIYIGTERTFTMARYEHAVAKAVQLRDAAEKAYRQDETRAKRAGALKLKARPRAARS
jgi:hypothetical protein